MKEQTTNRPAATMWGVAYRPAGMDPGTHLTSYLDGTLTEDEAAGLAAEWAQRPNIVAAWADHSERF